MGRAGDLEVHFKAKPGAQQIDNSAIAAITRGPGVRSDLRRRARNVQAAAKAQVGVKTGRLQGTIRIQEGGNTRGAAASVAVVAGRPGMRYTGYHHDGTGPHRITANGSGMLRFVSNGSVVFRRSVSHPGTKANPFLLDATRYWRP